MKSNSFLGDLKKGIVIDSDSSDDEKKRANDDNDNDNEEEEDDWQREFNKLKSQYIAPPEAKKVGDIFPSTLHIVQ